MKQIPMIPDFDGSKFAQRYGLDPRADFHAAGGILFFPDALPDEPIQETSDPVEVRGRLRAVELLDRQYTPAEVLIRAVVLEMLGYTNAKLTVIADTLRTKGVITLAERNNFVNGLATPAQARTAIKNRMTAGEADNGA